MNVQAYLSIQQQIRFLELLTRLQTFISYEYTRVQAKGETLLFTNKKRVVMDIRNYSLYFFESGTDMINVNRAKKQSPQDSTPLLLIFKKRYISIDNMTIGTDRKFYKALEDAALNIGKLV